MGFIAVSPKPTSVERYFSRSFITSPSFAKAVDFRPVKVSIFFDLIKVVIFFRFRNVLFYFLIYYFFVGSFLRLTLFQT